MGSLPSLKELWLDCNDLSELPPVSVSCLRNLNFITMAFLSIFKEFRSPYKISLIHFIAEIIQLFYYIGIFFFIAKMTIIFLQNILKEFENP